MKTKQRLGGMKAGLMLVLSLILLSGLVGATITYTAGTNLITLDDIPGGAGSSWATAYDMDDVLANCGAVVTKQGANAYDVSARMHFLSGVYFVSESEFVELKPNPANCVYTIRSEENSHLKFGRYDAANGYSYNGAFWQIYLQTTTGSQGSGSSDGTGNRLKGEVLIYGSNIICDSTAFQRGPHFAHTGSFRVYNSVCKWAGYFWSADTDIQDVKWFGGGGSYDMLVAAGPNFNWGRLTTMGCNYGIFFSSTTTSDVDVYGATILDYGSYQIMSSSHPWLIRLIDPTHTITSVNSIQAGKPGVKLCYTFNVKVTTATGSPIVGATVSLKDVEGTDAFTPEQTVAGGVLANDKIVTSYWWKNAAQGGNKGYNNHTLKVTSGADETEYNITIDHQMSEDVVLIPQSTATYDNIMGAIEATNSLSLSSVVGAFYFQEDEVEGSVLTRNRSGDLVSASVNVNVTYPNGSQLWAGAATEESTGRFGYNLTVPSSAPLGAYGVRIDANKSGSDAHDVAAFLVLSGSDSYPFLVIKSGVGILLLLFAGSILYRRRKNHAA